MKAVVLFLFLAAYFLPTIVALARSHHNAVAILLLNLFLGWTVIGWILALVWSVTKVLPACAQGPDAVPRLALAQAATKCCPFCAETIRAEALKCRHCHSMLDPAARVGSVAYPGPQVG